MLRVPDWRPGEWGNFLHLKSCQFIFKKISSKIVEDLAGFRSGPNIGLGRTLRVLDWKLEGWIHL